jgi:uncharacterized protein YndB with AHSA1/START domain
MGRSRREATSPAPSIAPIRERVTVVGSPDDAFATFADGFATWWPRQASWSGDVLESIGIEPRVGGFLWERGPHGFRADFGRVQAWEPPHRLVFSWQVGPDRTPEPNPARASEVEVRFRALGDGRTRVELEHRGFERHGEGGEAYRDGMAADAGWPSLLRAYASALQRRSEAPWEGLTT